METSSPRSIDPRLDGEDHINIWTKGRTDLGRWLSNFSYSPFVHPKYGKFNSMEGFYYYAATGFEFEEFRGLWGWKAKSAGKQLPKVRCEDFEDLLMEALEFKILYNPEWIPELLATDLPFTHYFVYGHSGNFKIHESNSSWWLTEGWHFIRWKFRILVRPDVETYLKVWKHGEKLRDVNE